MGRFKYITLYATFDKEWDEYYGSDTPNIGYKEGAKYSHVRYPTWTICIEDDPDAPEDATHDGWAHSNWLRGPGKSWLRKKMVEFESWLIEQGHDYELEYRLDYPL